MQERFEESKQESQQTMVQPEDHSVVFPSFLTMVQPEDHSVVFPSFLPEDLNYEAAVRAYSATSFSPEERARTDQQSYVQHMTELLESVKPRADTPEKQRALAAAMAEYKAGYLKHMMAYLAARSRVMSAAIVGPANFPVTRNEKRIASEDRRLDELLSWDRKARANISRMFPKPEQSAEDKLASLEKCHLMMKAANKIGRNASLTQEQKVASLMEQFGIKEKTAQEMIKENYGVVGFSSEDIAGIATKIRALKASMDAGRKEDERPSADYTFDGGVVTDNAQADRVQIFFDGKPDDDMRSRLKARGFCFSPKAGNAWQRKRNNAARAAVDAVLGTHFFTTL